MGKHCGRQGHRGASDCCFWGAVVQDKPRPRYAESKLDASASFNPPRPGANRAEAYWHAVKPWIRGCLVLGSRNVWRGWTIISISKPYVFELTHKDVVVKSLMGTAE